MSSRCSWGGMGGAPEKRRCITHATQEKGCDDIGCPCFESPKPLGVMAGMIIHSFEYKGGGGAGSGRGPGDAMWRGEGNQSDLSYLRKKFQLVTSLPQYGLYHDLSCNKRVMSNPDEWDCDCFLQELSDDIFGKEI